MDTSYDILLKLQIYGLWYICGMSHTQRCKALEKNFITSVCHD